MRVGVNVEQLLLPSPGGVGRYSAQLAMLLATEAPADEVVPFTAHHREALVRQRLAAAGVQGEPVVLPLPRALLYEAWVRAGVPPLGSSRRLRGLDLVHAPSAAVPPTGGSPLVVTLHDAAPARWPDAFTPRGRRWHQLAWAAARRRADAVITVSQAAADELVELAGIPEQRLRVVHNAVVPPAVDPAAGAALLRASGVAGRPVVLWVGSLEPRKGVDTLVQAMVRLPPGRDGRRPAVLVLAGYPGWLSEGLLPASARRAMGPDLVELGPLTDGALWSLYGSATVFAFPSRHEGFGLPPLEAMSQGAPVVASDLPATREILGDAAVLVPAGDPDAWADALGQLVADEGARLRLGAAGRERAARFDGSRMVQATRAVYREVHGGATG